MNWKRIGRALVCLLVVCCLLLNMFPVRAQALVHEIAIGIVALLILMACGVAFAPQTVTDVVAIGESFRTFMYQWGTGAEKLDEVEEWFGSLVIYDGGSDLDGDGEDDSPNERKVHLARGLLTGIAAWVGSVILGDTQVEVPEEAETGFAYYNGYEFPVLPTAVGLYSYAFINYYDFPPTGVQQYQLFFVDEPLVLNDDNTFSPLVSYNKFVFDSNSDSWSFVHTYSGKITFQSDDSNTIIWSGFDIYTSSGDLFLGASEPSPSELVELAPDTLVGEVAPAVKDGVASEDRIVELLPDTLVYGNIVSSDTPVQDAVISTSQSLADGSLYYDDLLTLIVGSSASEPDVDVDPTLTPDSGAEDLTQSVGNTNAGTFLDALVDALTAPFEWLAETLLEGIKAIFVPSEDFLTEKVEALRDEFSFADSIISAGELVGSTLQSLDTSPPVIYIDLGAARGSYYLGGKEVFIDLHWYEEYKPTVDALLSALLWIVFIWRLFMKAPGIISGMPGDFVAEGLKQIKD